MSRAQVLCLSAVAAVAGGGLLLMSRFGDLQLPSVLVYSGIAAFLGGLASAVLPPRWMGFSRRFHGPLAGVVTGAILFAAGWCWPVGVHRTPAPATRLDAFLSEYSFYERHEITVHAPPERVRRALDRITWEEIGVMDTLGRIRRVAIGGHSSVGRRSPVPVLASLKGPHTGFVALDDTPGEFVFGMAGEPWNNVAVRLTAPEFRSWSAAGNIKVAANFRIEGAGNGRSRLVTETRVAGCDATARHNMAHYWALIYPGSGMVRRSLLEAVRQRAEQ